MSKQSKFAGRALRAVAVSGIVLGTLAPVAASAAPYPNGGTTPPPSDPGSQVAAKTASQSTLPFTGSDAAGLAIIGTGAALAGVVMVRHGRRARATTA